MYKALAEASWSCLRAYHATLGRPTCLVYSELSEADREALVARAFWSCSTLPNWGSGDSEPLSIEGALMVAICRALKNAIGEAELAGLGLPQPIDTEPNGD